MIYGNEPWEPYNRVQLSTFLAGSLDWAGLVKDQKFPTQEIKVSDIEELEEFDSDDNQENIALLNVIWNKLGANCQELLKLHYYGKMKLTEIASYKEKAPAAHSLRVLPKPGSGLRG